MATSINTKPKPGWLPSLTYTLTGVANYPNYLIEKMAPIQSSEKNLKEYICHLESELERGKQALQIVQNRESWIPRNDQLLSMLSNFNIEDSCDANTVSALSGDSDLVERYMSQLVDGAVYFPLLSRDTCSCLLEEIIYYYSVATPPTYPKKCSIDFWGKPGQHFIDVLFNEVMRPMANILWGISGLDQRYSFIASYDKVSDIISNTALDRHTDDSEVTLTIPLGGTWSNGSVDLYGVRGTQNESNLQLSFPHINIGSALLHKGQLIHSVTPVDGTRHVLVIWGRSSAYRSSHCPCCSRFGRDMCLFQLTK